MIILVDSREQRPYWHGKDVAVFALSVGDYTTATLLGRFAIERKSASDLYSTIVHDHPRFRREILRAKEQRKKLVVVVEARRVDFLALAWSKKPLKLSPDTLGKILTTIEKRYRLEFAWLPTRQAARAYVLRRLAIEEARVIERYRSR